jgi:hypothetical protein
VVSRPLAAAGVFGVVSAVGAFIGWPRTAFSSVGRTEADEKFWAGLQGMNQSWRKATKVAAKSARIAADAESRATDAAKRAAVAKDRIDRLAKSEAVSGGLSKPMTRKDLLKAAGASPLQGLRNQSRLTGLSHQAYLAHCHVWFQSEPSRTDQIPEPSHGLRKP